MGYSSDHSSSNHSTSHHHRRRRKRKCHCHVHCRSFDCNVAAGRVEYQSFNPETLAVEAKVVSGDGKLVDARVGAPVPLPFPYQGATGTVTLNYTLELDVKFCKRLRKAPSVQLTTESASQTISVNIPPGVLPPPLDVTGLQAQLDLFAVVADNVTREGFTARGQIVITAGSGLEAVTFLSQLLLPADANPLKVDYVAVY